MRQTNLMRFALVPLVVLVTSFQCSNDHDDTAVNKCDCKTAPVAEEKKDVEVVVIQFNGYQNQTFYILSTNPADFGRTSYTTGQNILVPCDSLPQQYRQVGTRLIVDYKRRDCYGALTDPYLRSYYGYYVDLTAIQVKP